MSMPAANQQPYVGPRSFEENDGHLFFGRDREASDLASLVVAHEAVLLYSQSGAGKTSLINARIIPSLRDRGFRVLGPARVGLPMPDGVDSRQIANVFVFNSLLSWSGGVPATNLGSTSIHRFLSTFLPSIGSQSDSPTVIVFDQFEELFSTYPEQWTARQDLFRQLAESLTENPLLRVLFAMREEYSARMDRYANVLPDGLRIRFQLEQLSEKAALLAITEPLNVINGTERAFDENVAEHLVKDLMKVRVETDDGHLVEVPGEYVEPVHLQVVCRSLWDHLPLGVNRITEEYVHEFGNPDLALALFYEEAVRAAARETSVPESGIRAWFENWMITSTGTRGIVHRSPEHTEGLPNEAIDVLADRHLIRAEWRAGARWYELTHDRMVAPIRESNAHWSAQQEELSRKAHSALLQAEEYAVKRDQVRASSRINDAQMFIDQIEEPQYLVRALSQLGSLWMSQDRYEEAIDIYQHALQTDFEFGFLDDAAYHLLLIGHSFHQIEDYGNAIEYYTSYLQLRPTDPAGYDRRGAACWYSGRYQEAYDDYTVALELDESTFNTYNSRGQVLVEMGRFDEAIVDLNAALELGDDRIGNAYALNGRGLAHAGLGDYRRAEEDFNESIQRAPRNAWVYYNRALANEMKNDLGSASQDYRIALELDDPPLNPLKRERAEARIHEIEA